MVCELIHDPFLLARKSTPATPEDLPAAIDLKDTLLHHRESCVGMAANMIGICKAIIVFFDGSNCMTMLNPEILKSEGEYETEEGCLSLLGGPRKTGVSARSRSATRRSPSRPGSRLLKAFPPRSSSTRSTISTES